MQRFENQCILTLGQFAEAAIRRRSIRRISNRPFTVTDTDHRRAQQSGLSSSERFGILFDYASRSIGWIGRICDIGRCVEEGCYSFWVRNA